MKIDLHTGLVLVLLAAGVAGCDNPIVSPRPPGPSGDRGDHGPIDTTFNIADVTLSGVVYDTTSGARVPLAGVTVLNGEGNGALTDENGFYSMRPVWVCPCAAEPWIAAGTTFLWVEKAGYIDPPGTPASVFPRQGPGTRDVRIDGDTRFDLELVSSK